jgi:hypothetical protein
MNYSYENADQNLRDLRARFPKQFHDDMGMEWRWPDGWHHIVAHVCAQIDRLGLNIHWARIEERLGVLHMYAEGKEEELTQMGYLALNAMGLSDRTCRGCGHPGRVVDIDDKYFAYCEDCERRHREQVR